MARRYSLTPTATGNREYPWRINLPGKISTTGKRERRFFKTKAEAQTFKEQQEIRIENYGTKATSLTPGQLEEAAAAFESLASLAPLKVTLTQAVAEYIERHDRRKKSVTFSEMFAAFEATKTKKSVSYKRELKYTLPRFAGLHQRKACDITPGDVEKEMQGMPDSARNAFMRILRAAFNHGIEKEWVAANPIEKIKFADIEQGEVQTLTPAQAAALLAEAEDEHDLLPYHALALFAGIRPMELERLEWRHVDLVERHIEITAQVSKTGRRRIIEMEPNLHGWLSRFVETGGNTAGKVTPALNLRKRLRELREKAGITEWVQDVMRHSYASFWLAQHGLIDRLTLNMGHESAAMLFKHYHRSSKKADAAAFWKIEPAPMEGGNVVPMVAA